MAKVSRERGAAVADAAREMFLAENPGAPKEMGMAVWGEAAQRVGAELRAPVYPGRITRRGSGGRPCRRRRAWSPPPALSPEQGQLAEGETNCRCGCGLTACSCSRNYTASCCAGPG